MNERELIAFFKDIHAHPELGGEEFRTTEKVVSLLHANGIETLDTGLKTGAIAVFHGKKPGKIIGLRGDMDALPVQEESGLPYASQIPGVMHACGHDFHTSTVLGAALLLKQREAELCGKIYVVFQPAEEIADGGKSVVATHLLDDAEEFYGVHTYPGYEVGTLGIKEGPVMAAPDRFAITIRGVGAHAAQPHKGVDPIPAAASLALTAQTIVSRTIDPFVPAVVSVTHLSAGNTWNVVPETAFVEGTVRTLRPEDRKHIHATLDRMAEATAQAYGCTAEIEWEFGPDSVINDAALCEVARALALEMGFKVGIQEDTMGGEDFSEYTKHCPGVFIRVGTGGSYANHHPKFTADPAALWPAANFCAELAIRRARGE